MVYEDQKPDEAKEPINEEGSNIGDIQMDNTSINQSQSDIEELNFKVKTLNDDKLRLLAEMDNIKKRDIRGREDLKKSMIRQIALDLMNVSDQLEQAKSFFKSSDSSDPVISGINGLLKTLSDVFGRWNIVPIVIEIGKTPVNANYHEVISVINGSKDVILVEVSKGYLLKNLDEEYVLRPSKVVVGNGED